MVSAHNHPSARSGIDAKRKLGKEAKDSAWYYEQPITDKAAPIKDHVAFCRWSEASKREFC